MKLTKKQKELLAEEKEETKELLKKWKSRQPVVVPHPEPPKPSEPFAPYLVRVLYYHELYGKSKWEVENPRIKVSPPAKPFADPATWKLLADNGKPTAPFTQEWQDYWISLMSDVVRLQNPIAPDASVLAVAIHLFDYAFRGNTVMCNKNGGSYGSKDILLECIAMSGNVLTVVGNSKMKAGVKCLPVRVCNSKNSPPQIAKYSGNIWGTIETNMTKGGDPKRRITRSFEGLNIIKNKLPMGITRTSTTWIPYTLIANGCDVAWIPAQAVIEITEEQANKNIPF